MKLRTDLTALLFIALASAAAPADDLNGAVRDNNGNPLAEATVFIHTAKPRFGTSILCPSCYADCKKQATTDAEGRFTIADLDPSLVFRILVEAEGFRPKLMGDVGPAAAEPEVLLDPLPTNFDPALVLRGRVVDKNGEPAVGAEVEPSARHTGSSTRYGRLNEIDPISITNQRGEFLLVASEPADGYSVDIRSPRHATKKFMELALGRPHELVVGAGATVRGRLVKNGRPVAGVVVGLVQCDRASRSFLGVRTIGTNDDGQFEFAYVPPEDDYYLYTEMETMAAIGALPLRRVTVGGDESVQDLGDLAVGPAHTLSGRIVLTDGGQLFGPVQVMLSRVGAWDSQELMVEVDGRFEFYAVPHDEPIRILVRVPGCRLASDRNHFQQDRDRGIGVFVDRSRDDVLIHFERDE